MPHFHWDLREVGRHGCEKMTIAEKVAYIKGLAEGMKITADTNEGKITLALLDVLNDIAMDLEEVDETLDDMAEVVGEIADQVDDLEEEVYGDYEDDFDYDDDDDEEMYEITCNNCDNTIAIEMDMLDGGSINCPNCGEKIKLDIDFLTGDGE